MNDSYLLQQLLHTMEWIGYCFDNLDNFKTVHMLKLFLFLIQHIIGQNLLLYSASYFFPSLQLVVLHNLTLPVLQLSNGPMPHFLFYYSTIFQSRHRTFTSRRGSIVGANEQLGHIGSTTFLFPFLNAVDPVCCYSMSSNDVPHFNTVLGQFFFSHYCVQNMVFHFHELFLGDLG